MHDKFKKRHRVSRVDSRLRRQIAQEAARRMVAARTPIGEEETAPPTDLLWLDASTEADYHAAKRKAVAVLGHRIRPTDLPTDEEVREQVESIVNAGYTEVVTEEVAQESDQVTAIGRMADHLDRFTLYKMRLAPLEAVKQNPKTHPEGDALYHSLQVFDRARAIHPYDEEFLLAALLHDVGKGINPQDHVSSSVEALRGAVTERTLWLIEHHMDLCSSPRYRRPVESSVEGWKEDLEALREIDDAGRVPGVPASSIDEALDYLRSLDRETFLEE